MRLKKTSSYNRFSNCKNRFQGANKKVLCVCSAGLLRSPTAALVLSQEPYNFNTRAAGIDEEYALIPVDDVLIEWADEIVCMDDRQAHAIKKLTSKPIICLNIKDQYEYRDKKLMDFIKTNYDAFKPKKTKKKSV